MSLGPPSLTASTALPAGHSDAGRVIPAYSGFLPVRFAKPRRLLTSLVRSYRTVSPLPRRVAPSRRSVLCCTVSGLATGGRYPPPCPVEPGLSSLRRSPMGAGSGERRSSWRLRIPRFQGAREPGIIATMEFVYVVKRYDLFDRSFPHGFVTEPDAVAEWTRRIRERGFFLERRQAEQDSSFKQIIPYTLVLHGEQV